MGDAPDACLVLQYNRILEFVSAQVTDCEYEDLLSDTICVLVTTIYGSGSAAGEATKRLLRVDRASHCHASFDWSQLSFPLHVRLQFI